ncbi:glutathione peroxidase [Dyadobacter jejuensis]|uniref:Glutathione peroxidase n=1 Tax=Dyadobacter jejuensis TaxID=1082580 RepID=A0A316AZD3_9BACT|nr:glutathione peroxidase [Dyadobacter jejuensis]PWJ55597.1 glutathione peroxidase [Dyadobacter jejuensis]
MSFYDLSAHRPNGTVLPFSDFQGKTVLIVNTATQCGLAPQFEGLEVLHERYADKGLVVLGFPCNQFRNQEPETNETVEMSCRMNHGVTFQLTKKVDVNGPDTDPVFVFLKKSLGGFLGKRIKWNFTKFLIGPDGKPYKRYAPTTKPAALEEDIQKLLTLPVGALKDQ